MLLSGFLQVTRPLTGVALCFFYWFLQVIRPLTGLTGDTVGIRHTTLSPH